MADARITLHPKMHRPTSIALTETHWGYILRSVVGNDGGSVVSDAVLRFVGIVLVMTAYAVWLVPQGLMPGDPTQVKALMALGLACGGAALYFYAARRRAFDTQIDTTARELRLTRRGRRGKVRILRRMPFAGVESAFVRRGDAKPAELFLRLTSGETVAVLTGLERDLNLVHARFCRDLKSPEERMEMRLSVAQPKPVRAVRLSQARRA